MSEKIIHYPEKEPMAKMTIEDLHRIKQETLPQTALRHQAANVSITVHMGECGIAAGARQTIKALMAELGKSGRHDIHILAADCPGVCETEPNVTVEIAGQAPVVYQKVDPEKIRLIFDRHVLNGEIQTGHTVELPDFEEAAQTSEEA